MRACSRFARVVTRPGGCVWTWATWIASIGVFLFFAWLGGTILRKTVPMDWLPQICQESEVRCVIVMSGVSVMLVCFIFLIFLALGCMIDNFCYQPCQRDWNAESD